MPGSPLRGTVQRRQTQRAGIGVEGGDETANAVDRRPATPATTVSLTMSGATVPP